MLCSDHILFFSTCIPEADNAFSSEERFTVLVFKALHLNKEVANVIFTVLFVLKFILHFT